MTLIELHNNQSSHPVDEVGIIQNITKLVVEGMKLPTHHIILHFIDLEESGQLHAQFFDDPDPTDCMTFPIDPLTTTPSKDHTLGEIMVCPAVAAKACMEHATTYIHELYLYIVHGLLHLQGFDDLDSDSLAIMRAQEAKWMTWLSHHTSFAQSFKAQHKDKNKNS